MLDGQFNGPDEELILWYKSLSTLRVDIVGDFAGKELFAIHGDSLILHCISNAGVDFAGTSICRLLLSLQLICDTSDQAMKLIKPDFQMDFNCYTQYPQ